MSTPLFHLAAPDLWTAFTEAGDAATYEPASLAAEGFCHLSLREQIPGTLEMHFRDARELVLVELAIAREDPALRFEVSRGDERFPHLYRAITRADVHGSRTLRRKAQGSWDGLS